MSDQLAGRWRTVLAISLARLAEVALALIGLAYVFGAEDPTYKTNLLGLCALVALTYLSVASPGWPSRPTCSWTRAPTNAIRRSRRWACSSSSATVDYLYPNQ